MHSKIELNVMIGKHYLKDTNEKNYTTCNQIL